MPQFEGKIAGKKNTMKLVSSNRIAMKMNYIQLRQKQNKTI